MHLILKPLDMVRRWLPEPNLTKARYDTEGAWLSNCFSRVGEILQQVETQHNGNSKGAERVRWRKRGVSAGTLLHWREKK